MLSDLDDDDDAEYFEVERTKKSFYSLIEGYKKINEKGDIVRESKKVKYPRQKYMKTKEELENSLQRHYY